MAEAPGGEDVSRRYRTDSASLHQYGVVKSPEAMKPCIDGEATTASSHRTPIGANVGSARPSDQIGT